MASCRNKPITVIETGVFHSGSLEMWRDYFGPQARVIGVDIGPCAEKFEADGIALVEDLHTSHWPSYGGGYLKPDTFIEFGR